jgi:hypothetical protein
MAESPHLEEGIVTERSGRRCLRTPTNMPCSRLEAVTGSIRRTYDHRDRPAVSLIGRKSREVSTCNMRLQATVPEF